MTDYNKLIKQAQDLSAYVREHIPGSRYRPMIDRLTSAVKKLLTEAEEAKQKLEVVETERDALQNRINDAVLELAKPLDSEKVLDTHAGRALWKAVCADNALKILTQKSDL